MDSMFEILIMISPNPTDLHMQSNIGLFNFDNIYLTLTI